ncbi:hypothetical protein FRC10_011739 [Ceratobasidium sp. 414]|nr:hypothetical protein FRC10_011739 [Ceratobasidium sp. 414]
MGVYDGGDGAVGFMVEEEEERRAAAAAATPVSRKKYRKKRRCRLCTLVIALVVGRCFLYTCGGIVYLQTYTGHLQSPSGSSEY